LNEGLEGYTYPPGRSHAQRTVWVQEEHSWHEPRFVFHEVFTVQIKATAPVMHGRTNLIDAMNDKAITPPRQNSCRPDRTTTLGAAMKDGLGSIRTGIQGQGGGEIAAT